MSQATIITIMQEAISTTLTVALPPILVGLVVGIIVSIFQAATQINEQTLAFVPKIVGILASLLLFGGSMLTNLTEFAQHVYVYMIQIV